MSLAKIEFTAAVFRIERPFANINQADKVFEISGEQVNKGLELSAVGDVVENLRVYGGVTLLSMADGGRQAIVMTVRLS